MRISPHIRYIVTLAVVIVGMTGGVLFAQVWQQPPGAPPGALNQDPTPGLEVLHSGGKILGSYCSGGTNDSMICTVAGDCPGGICKDWTGGGEAEARSGRLRVGDTTVPSQNLEVGGTGRAIFFPWTHVGFAGFTNGSFCQGGTNDLQACTSLTDCPGGGSCTNASLAALSSGSRYGVYGATSQAISAGVTGVTSVLNGGKGVMGSTLLDGATAVYGGNSGAGTNGRAVYGQNANTTNGYAGYFDGRVFATSLIAGAAAFNGDVSVTGNTSVSGSLLLNGNDIASGNIPSVQNQASAVPITDPGVKFFVKEVSGLGVGLSSTIDLRIGNPILTNTDMVIRIVAVYRNSIDESDPWKIYNTGNPDDLYYRQCDSAGVWNGNAGRIVVRNGSATTANFRIVGYYQTMPAGTSMCQQFEHRRQLTIPASDTGDSIVFKLGTLTTPDASSFYNASLSGIKGDDVRIYYNGNQIDRDVIAFAVDNVEIVFKAQNTSASPDAGYYIYYGNTTLTNPPANKNNVYALWDDFTGTTIDTEKWTTVTDATAPTGSVAQNNELQLITAAGTSGAGAYSTPTFSKTGFYTMSYQWSPGADSAAGLDGVYVHPDISTRDALYADLTSRYIRQGLENSPFSTMRMSSRGTGAASFVGAIHSPGSPFLTTNFYAVKFTLNANTGAVTLYPPASGTPLSGTVLAADLASIGGQFVVEMHNGGATAGTERYDDFLLRRGGTAFDPAPTIGAEEQGY